MDSAKSVMDIFAESVALVNWSPTNSEAPSPTTLKVFITLVIKSAAPPYQKQYLGNQTWFQDPRIEQFPIAFVIAPW